LAEPVPSELPELLLELLLLDEELPEAELLDPELPELLELVTGQPPSIFEQGSQ
jgi:hypothetical protein